MSNGLADASFFPTAKELSTGLRWVKDHPVLAAAAATAVSVITFLNAAETLAHSRSSATLLDDAQDDDSLDRSTSLDGSATVCQKHDIVTRRRKVESESHARTSAAAKRAVAALSSSSGRTSPPSDAKLAAAVSWCDEHGGSLTQVFEDMHVTDDDAVERDSASGAAGVASTEPSDVASAIKKSSTRQSVALSALERDLVRSSSDDSPCDDDPRDAASPSTTELFERQTESPQWGWYVAITPPQDALHSALPRAALPPPHRGSSSASSRAPLHTGAAPSASLRRSTSGRIPSSLSSSSS